jgi:nucleoside-diphosphate-sugar epimerase
MKKVLITGASGFVGRHLVPALENLGYEVIGLNSFNFSDMWVIQEKMDYIIHLAVKTAAGGYCQQHPGEQYLINTSINIDMLYYWQQFQPQAKMITFGSSCGYNDNVLKFEENYLEGEPETGYEVYGNVKRNLLIGLRALNKEYNMDYSYLIPSVFYGPEYDLHDKHFIFDLIRKIVNAKNTGEKVVLWGTGDQTRELIYIEDAIDLILQSLTWKSKIVNLSSGKAYSLKEYAQTICDIVGYDFNLIEWDVTQFVGSRSKNLINNQLYDYKFTPLKDGLTKTIKYYEDRSSSSK